VNEAYPTTTLANQLGFILEREGSNNQGRPIRLAQSRVHQWKVGNHS